jgi:membrane protein implicated in regulation of membrane protease activity
MHIIAVAWIFVVVLVALAEATAPQGTVLGALFTLVGWGVLPLSILLYVLNTPARKRRLRRPAQDSTNGPPHRDDGG